MFMLIKIEKAIIINIYFWRLYMLDGPRLRWFCGTQSVGGKQQWHGIIYSVMIMSPLTVMLCWPCSGPRQTDLWWPLVHGGDVSNFSRSGLHPGNPGPVSAHIFFNWHFLQLVECGKTSGGVLCKPRLTASGWCVSPLTIPYYTRRLPAGLR